MKRLTIASAAALLLLARPGSARAAGESSCAACHRGAKTTAYVAHNFADWERSPHAEAGVSCEACHGGDSAAADEAAAHAGVLPSTATASPTYFTTVPRTCGACHRAEYAAFRTSRHYAELMRAGRGPNCVTCHGAMASRVLAPREMEMTCTLCHRKPTDAFMARLTLDDSASLLARLGRALERAKAAGRPLDAQQRAYDEAYRLQSAAIVDWHAFDMAKVREETQEVKIRAGKALGEIRAAETPAER